MRFTEQQKIEILEYARDCGNVTKAARHFNVCTLSIRNWNKKFNILSPVRKTPKKYSTRQKRKVLQEACEFGRKLVAKKYDISLATLYLWNKKLKVYDSTPRKTYSDAEKIEICKYARKHGMNAAFRKYGVTTSYIKSWIAEFNIPKRPGRKPKRTTRRDKNYTEAEIIERLEYARDYGITAAKRHYCLGGESLQKWNEVYKIYVTQKPSRRFTREEKIRIVTDAKEIGILAAAEKHSVNPDRISVWNRQLGGIYQAREYTKYTEEYRLMVKEFAQNTSVPFAARKFGLSSSQIYRWMKNNKIRTA